VISNENKISERRMKKNSINDRTVPRVEMKRKKANAQHDQDVFLRVSDTVEFLEREKEVT
jgi:hypothetical protein